MALTNYYAELDLDQGDSVTLIRENLNLCLLQHAKMAARSGSHQQDSLHKIELIEAALGVFHDDESKRQYDSALERETLPGPKVDWYAKVLEYRDAGEFGAAHVAARRAKQQKPNDSGLYLATAWIYVDEGGRQALDQALREANEALVLDINGEWLCRIEEARGEIYTQQEDYQRGIQCFDRALKGASASVRSIINRRKARNYLQQGEYQLAIESLDKAFIGAGPEQAAEINRFKAEIYYAQAGSQLEDREHQLAIESLDKAFIGAGPEQAAEIKRFKARIYYLQAVYQLEDEEYQQTLESTLQGLELLVDSPSDDYSWFLSDMVIKCINCLAGDCVTGADRRYRECRELILEAPMHTALKTKILNCIDENMDRCKLNACRNATITAFHNEIDELSQVPAAGGEPEFPGFAIGGAIVAFLIGSLIGKDGALFFLIALGVAVYIGLKLNARSRWKETYEKHHAAENRISAIRDELRSISRKPELPPIVLRRE